MTAPSIGPTKASATSGPVGRPGLFLLAVGLDQAGAARDKALAGLLQARSDRRSWALNLSRRGSPPGRRSVGSNGVAAAHEDQRGYGFGLLLDDPPHLGPRVSSTRSMTASARSSSSLN